MTLHVTLQVCCSLYMKYMNDTIEVCSANEVYGMTTKLVQYLDTHNTNYNYILATFVNFIITKTIKQH